MPSTWLSATLITTPSGVALGPTAASAPRPPANAFAAAAGAGAGSVALANPPLRPVPSAGAAAAEPSGGGLPTTSGAGRVLLASRVRVELVGYDAQNLAKWTCATEEQSVGSYANNNGQSGGRTWTSFVAALAMPPGPQASVHVDVVLVAHAGDNNAVELARAALPPLLDAATPCHVALRLPPDSSSPFPPPSLELVLEQLKFPPSCAASILRNPFEQAFAFRGDGICVRELLGEPAFAFHAAVLTLEHHISRLRRVQAQIEATDERVRAAHGAFRTSAEGSGGLSGVSTRVWSPLTSCVCPVPSDK